MVTWKVKGLYKADPEKVYSEITAIDDTFTPEQIVAKAKNKRSELHKCFEWDDTAAADKWRLHQARMLVAQLVITVESSDAQPVAVRVISSASERNVYAQTVSLIKSDTDYADLLQRALRELNAFKAKYSTVNELREIFDKIDELSESA